jgi:hypothetical protein
MLVLHQYGWTKSVTPTGRNWGIPGRGNVNSSHGDLIFSSTQGAFVPFSVSADNKREELETVPRRCSLKSIDQEQFSASFRGSGGCNWYKLGRS